MTGRGLDGCWYSSLSSLVVQDTNPREGQVCPQVAVKIASQVVLEACLLHFSMLSMQQLTLLATMLTVGSSGVFELHTCTPFYKFNLQGPCLWKHV